MRNAFLAILLLFVVCSCKSVKKATETDRSTSQTITERQITTRPGDTITIDIPNVRYKDTIIERVDYVNKTVARVTYDDKGNQTFECMQAEIRMLTEKINEMVQNDVKRDTEQTNQFNPQHLIYAMGGLGLVLILGIMVVGIMVTRVQKQMPAMTAQILKDVMK